MGTIKSQIENKINRSLESFESIHDADLCGFIDFFYKVNDNITVGFALVNAPDNTRLTAAFDQALKDFETKFGGKAFVVNYDSATDKIEDGQLEDIQEHLLKLWDDINNRKVLNEMGLTNAETNAFLRLLNKMVLPEKYESSFNIEMEADISFEGGIGFSEALTGMLLSIEK